MLIRLCSVPLLCLAVLLSVGCGKDTPVTPAKPPPNKGDLKTSIQPPPPPPPPPVGGKTR